MAEAKAIAELSEDEGPEVDLKSIRDQVDSILDRVNAFNVLLGDPPEEIVEADEVPAPEGTTPDKQAMPKGMGEASVADARRILAERQARGQVSSTDRRLDRWDELQRGALGRE